MPPLERDAAPSNYPAFCAPPAISSEIYPALFDWFFASEEFQCWYQGGSNWQLRCIGGPGSGKTTLSALTVRYLHERCHGADAVAAVFIRSDVLTNEAAFVNAFLLSIYHQLAASNFPHDSSSSAYLNGHGVRENAKRAAPCIDSIRNALYSRLSDLNRTFLVVDDFDWCSPALRLLLIEELSQLQRWGLSIMVTSRVPLLLEDDPETISCDVNESHTDLRLFWECQTCNGTNFIMCHPCREKGEVCQNCSSASGFVEPYEYIDFEVGWIPTESIQKFVAWDLEKEHGDLGLQSLNDTKPPLSSRGKELRQRHGGDAQRHLESIVFKAFGNVGIAKLRLDLVHSTQSLEAVEIVRDRLPGNIIALFDAGIQRLEKQPDAQRELGLCAIAAAVHSYEGVPFATLERWVHEATSKSGAVKIPPHTLEDVLQAAQGFLVVSSEVDRVIQYYHNDFYLYASEDYNESLLWARSQLRFDRLARSFTLADKLKLTLTNTGSNFSSRKTNEAYKNASKNFDLGIG
ncbi:uncharacterized protein K441DRAFT_694885 [Cenococcum geophilum 1.58]|uniref:uncharacterized protein n=1 Tax=Cenococcum geophilum 1.58 TaxID=794803 RepID=UPI00358E33D2|nr:hypothetical protein K441DRAFT_694885 [Cenococcum geophilum 1.58]